MCQCTAPRLSRASVAKKKDPHKPRILFLYGSHCVPLVERLFLTLQLVSSSLEGRSRPRRCSCSQPCRVPQLDVPTLPTWSSSSVSTPLATTALTLLNCKYAQNTMATTRDFLYWPRPPDAEILPCRSMSTPTLSVQAVEDSWHEECPGGCKEKYAQSGNKRFLVLARCRTNVSECFPLRGRRKGKAKQNSQKCHRNFQTFLEVSVKLCVKLDFHRRSDDARHAGADRTDRSKKHTKG